MLSYAYTIQSFKLMGQCMPVDAELIRFHPLLGNLQQRNGVVEVGIPIGGQEEYLSWSKRINKLKCSHECKQFLFLPLRETYVEDSIELCGNMHQVTLVFEPYAETLYDNLVRNCQAQHRYQEREVWYLLDTLVRYAALFRNGGDSAGLTFHSVVILRDGSLKVIPEIVTPSTEVQFNLYMASERVGNESTRAPRGRKSIIQVIGTLTMALAGLFHPDILYSTAKRSWTEVSSDKLSKMLAACEVHYSFILNKILRDMTNAEAKERITLDELLRRLEPFQGQLEAASANRASFGSTKDESQHPAEEWVFNADLSSPKNSHAIQPSEGREQLQHSYQGMRLQGSLRAGGEGSMREWDNLSVSMSEDYPTIL